jgi:hypothetical protein
MENAEIVEMIEKLRQTYKPGEIVKLEGQTVIFTGFGANFTASLYFRNGNVWNHPLEKVTKYKGDIKRDRFARQLKLQRYGIRDWRYNFETFL